MQQFSKRIKMWVQRAAEFIALRKFLSSTVYCETGTRFQINIWRRKSSIKFLETRDLQNQRLDWPSSRRLVIISKLIKLPFPFYSFFFTSSYLMLPFFPTTSHAVFLASIIVTMKIAPTISFYIIILHSRYIIKRTCP